MGDEVLAGAVEAQADEALALRHDHRATAHFVDIDNVVSPALQGANGAVEKSRRNYLGFQWLKRRAAGRPHLTKAEDGTGPAVLDLAPPRAAAEIGELKLEARQPSVVGFQRPRPRQADMPAPDHILITLC